MTDWQRLEQVIKWTGLSTNAFAVGIGLKRSENLYQIKRGNNGISKELAELIARKYPTANRAWLLTGEGEPFLSNEVVPSGAEPTNGPHPQLGIPYYSSDVMRLVSEWEEEPQGAPAYRMDIPSFGACDFAAQVTGSALMPELPSGAIVALKRVESSTSLLSGEIYLVVTADFALLRYARPHAIAGKIVLATTADQDALVLDRKRIQRLYRVQGIIIPKV